MSESWPPALKDWVAKCLGQMTDSNREEAQAELRKVIQEAYTAKTLWTTDWAGMQLQSLEPKVSSLLLAANSLKRKAEATPTKKNKKVAVAKHQVTFFNSDDQIAKEKRSRRFEREHELEKRRIPGVEPSPSNSPSPFATLQGSRGVSPLTRISHSPYHTVDQPSDVNELDWEGHKIVGRSQTLFKEYLRLTDAPNPETIRPLPILQQTLEALKQKWLSAQNYNWTCSQFKSLRQDLTVQGIKTSFTAMVYEIHARMALESGDMVEFNQCLSNLKLLYALRDVKGKVDEFTAYMILFMLHARQRSELNRLIGELTAERKAIKAIRHALNVSTALSTNNYHSLFQLYNEAPNMGAYIMDHFISRSRVQALVIMCKAYQRISLNFINEELAFEKDGTHDFLVAHGAAFYTNPNVSNTEKLLDVKQAGPALAAALESKYRRVAIKGSI